MTPATSWGSSEAPGREWPCLGIDIGGANIKLSDGLQFATSRELPLWDRPEQLVTVLSELWDSAPPSQQLAVTMTGELADCFASKAEGVAFILAAVEQSWCRRRGRPQGESASCQVYALPGRLLSLSEAERHPLTVAAANWHALAFWVAKRSPGTGLVLDIGSTTSDLIPWSDGRVRAAGATDTQRLQAGELVYTGVRRTPVCAVAASGPYRGRPCRLAAEVFATMEDVYLVLGELPERDDAQDTADGRPATRHHAQARLARMLCADATEFGTADAVVLAESLAAAQLERLREAVEQVVLALPAKPGRVLTSGSGEFLARRLAEQALPGAELQSFSDHVGAGQSTCGPAYALARLLREG